MVPFFSKTVKKPALTINAIFSFHFFSDQLFTLVFEPAGAVLITKLRSCISRRHLTTWTYRRRKSWLSRSWWVELDLQPPPAQQGRWAGLWGEWVVAPLPTSVTYAGSLPHASTSSLHVRKSAGKSKRILSSTGYNRRGLRVVDGAFRFFVFCNDRLLRKVSCPKGFVRNGRNHFL